MMCCGGTLSGVNDDLGRKFVRIKMNSINSAGGDLMVVGCPYCYEQYELSQVKLSREGMSTVPVLYYTELLALALDLDIGYSLKKHKVPTSKLVEKVEKLTTKDLGPFDPLLIHNCARCRACVDLCPISMIMGLDPLGVIDKVDSGDINAAMESPEIWHCLTCFKCYEQCPQQYALVAVFKKLRGMSYERGMAPMKFSSSHDRVMRTGYTVVKNDELRGEYGLSSVSSGDVKGELKKLLEDEVDDE